MTEVDFNKIKHTINGILPTMAISTIKYDENDKPPRAKYRIVSLGNMDPHSWSKSECYAPVLSMGENRLIISLEIHHGVPLTSGDFVQDLCQKYLPREERYVVTPPHGCSKSKSKALV